MPLSPSEQRHAQQVSDSRKDRESTTKRGDGGSGAGGSKCVGVKPNFPATYSNGTWTKK